MEDTTKKKAPLFTHRFKAVVCNRRVKCNGCNIRKIENGEIKIQKATFNGWIGNWSWPSYHMDCIFAGFNPRLKIVINSVEDIGGFDDLAPKYQGYIRALLKTYHPRYTSEKNKPKEEKDKIDKGESSAEGKMPRGKKGSSAKSRKKKAEEEPEEAVPTKKGKKSTESKTKKTSKAKVEPTTSKKAEAQNSGKKGKAKPGASKAEPSPKKPKKKIIVSSSEDSDSEEEVVVSAPTKKAPAATKTTDKKTLSEDAKQSFRDLQSKVQSGEKLTVADFSVFTVNELKLAIKLNDRSTTGNKTDLAKNLVDYMTNGCPPRCPECGGGRLKTRGQGKALEYYCPGFMEDDEFVNCAYTADVVVRIPWKSP